MNGWRTVAILALIAGGIASFFLTGGNNNDSKSSADSNLPDGYYLNGVTLTGMDTGGTIRYVLRAERIDHNPDDGSIDLQDLTLDYGNTQNPWQMRARAGRMPKTNNNITLSGGVQILNGRFDDEGTSKINSDTLFVDIDNQTANSSDRVTVSARAGTLNGVGLEVDLANETIDILSDVSGTFAPAQ